VGPDGDWLEEFMAKDYPVLVAGLRLICRDAGMAEDAVQEADAAGLDRNAGGPSVIDAERRGRGATKPSLEI
jgi:predicted RNA polymerase sigma factor